MSPTRKAATWRDSSGVPATAHRADVSTLRPKTQTRARRQYHARYLSNIAFSAGPLSMPSKIPEV